LTSLTKILCYASTKETKAEFRQEIFHEYGGVMQLVMEGEFTRLKNDRQKNRLMKTIENLENRITEMGKIGYYRWEI
jgi:hypothetical protein